MNRRVTRIGLGVAAMALHGVATAFIDERTPEPPAMPATPLVASAAQSGALFDQTSTEPVLADPNLIGTFAEPIWQAAYPGPFGTMPMADAVIAQVVPVKGAVRLDGDARLLNRKVTITQGQTRYQTLLAMAQAAGISVDLSQGNQVVIAPARVGSGVNPPVGSVRDVTPMRADQSEPVPVPGTQASVTSTAKDQALEPAVATTMAAEPVAIVPSVPKPIWEIDRGVMLSAGLRKWFEEQGWQLVWRAKVDYQIVAPVRITDDFLAAVDKILDAYKNADRPLIGYAHEAQRVIVVTEPGLKNASVERRPIAVTAPAGAAQVSE